MKRSPVLTRSPVIILLALSSAALIACQTQPDRDLGDSLDDRSLDLLPPPESTEPFGVSPLEFVGRWVGVAEEPLALGSASAPYTFPSGSTQFELNIAPPEQLAVASLRGTLVFGTGAPPPPLDSEIGYPSDVDYAQLAYFERNALSASNYRGPLPPYEGFPYEIRETLLGSSFGLDDAGGPTIADGVLQLEFDTGSLLTPWCEQQAPQPTASGYSSCVKGNGALADDDGQCFVSFSDLTPEQEAEVLASGASLATEQVDCDKLFLCFSGQCECTESECHYNYADHRSWGDLILRRDGDTLTGVFSNTVFLNARQLPAPLGTVRFTRVDD